MYRLYLHLIEFFMTILNAMLCSSHKKYFISYLLIYYITACKRNFNVLNIMFYLYTESIKHKKFNTSIKLLRKIFNKSCIIDVKFNYNLNRNEF